MTAEYYSLLGNTGLPFSKAVRVGDDCMAIVG